MKLADYLTEPGRTATALATAVCCSVSTITRAAKGEVIPNRDLMIRIFVATGGDVTPNDFFDLDTARSTLNAEPELPLEPALTASEEAA